MVDDGFEVGVGIKQHIVVFVIGLVAILLLIIDQPVKVIIAQNQVIVFIKHLVVFVGADNVADCLGHNAENGCQRAVEAVGVFDQQAIVFGQFDLISVLQITLAGTQKIRINAVFAKSVVIGLNLFDKFVH